MFYFITGSQGKFGEVKAILPEIEQLEIDLPEIQDIDAKKIIEEKLRAAKAHHDGEFIVEDTSLYLEALNGLPGPLIKWFLKTIKDEGLANLAKKLDNRKAVAKTIIGYSGKDGEISFFEGQIEGMIVFPKGENGFGWDKIFLPNGFDKTFGEMDKEQKNQISMRKIAAEKLRVHLKGE